MQVENKKSSFINRQSLSWALYDWANSAFTLVVITGFFPIIYREYWAINESSQNITFQLATVNSLSSLLIIFLAPLIGAYADQKSVKKKLLGLFAWLAILMTLSMYWVGSGEWRLGLVLFFIGSVSYMAANVMSDSLLINVSTPKTVDMISSLGFSLGYIGSGLMFVFCYWMTQDPSRFGLENANEAIQRSFILVAIWWAVFSLPVLLWVKEPAVPAGARQLTFFGSIKSSFASVISTAKTIGQHKSVVIFLLAYFLYIDGVDTIIRMAVDYGKALEFDTSSLLTALLMTQFIAFPATLAFGWLGGKFGTRPMLLVGIRVYVIVVIWGSLIQSERGFFYIATLIGLVQGGVQSLSRAMYTRLIPKDRAAEFFGFYNIMGKSAVFLGPLLMGTVTVWTDSHRIGLLVLLVFFIAGAAVLMKVPLPDEQR